MDHYQDLKVITRRSEPTKLDTANYLTICQVSRDIDYWEAYIQLSQDQENPNWEYLGSNKTSYILIKLIDLLRKK